MKQRQLNHKTEVLWLRMLKGTRMRRPFPLYNDRDIFRCGNKDCYELLGKKLIDHKQDDDYDTDEEVVDRHVDMCLQELE